MDDTNRRTTAADAPEPPKWGDGTAAPPRTGEVERITRETSVRARVGLDGTGAARIATGIGFLDHMIDQLARHGLLDIELEVVGDLHVDGHHSAEDSGIALGQAVAAALGDRRGIQRYGDATVPLDEALCRVVVDVSGRPYLVWRVGFSQPRLGTLDTELVREWFQAFAQHAGITLHVECLHGDNNHHIAESAFKALARALRGALERDPRRDGEVPSTKGTLGGRSFPD